MACKYLNMCNAVYKDAYCEIEPPYENSSCANFIKLDEEEKKSNNPYWENICAIADNQRKKGIETYGQGLEDNTWDILKRIQYLEEELVDALMYLEWCKDYLSKQSPLEKSNVKECKENGT